MELANGNKSEIYSEFRAFGIGKRSAKQEEKIKNFGTWQHRLSHAVNKFNPGIAIPRSAALLGVRWNIFNIATMLYPAFLSEAEAKKRNFNIANLQKAKESWDKVQRVFRDLGGEPSALEKVIKKGYDKPIFKHGKKAKAKDAREKGNFDGHNFVSKIERGTSDEHISNIVEEYSQVTGYDDAAIAAYISTGLSLLGAVAGAVKKGGASKNPYDNKKIDTAGADAPALTPEQIAELDKLKKLADADKAAGLGLDGSNGTLMGNPKIKYAIFGFLGLLALGIIVKVVSKGNKK